MPFSWGKGATITHGKSNHYQAGTVVTEVLFSLKITPGVDTLSGGAAGVGRRASMLRKASRLCSKPVLNVFCACNKCFALPHPFSHMRDSVGKPVRAVPNLFPIF